MDNSFCDGATHEAIKFVVGALITTGLFVSYIPQFRKFVTTRSSDGISSLFLLLGAIGATSSFFNMVLLQFPNIQCCLYSDWWTPSFCVENTLGLFQVGTQFACFSTVFIMFYVYFPRDLTGYTPSDLRRIHREWATARTVAYAVGTFLVGTIIAAIWALVKTHGAEQQPSLLRSRDVSAAEWLAGVLGLIATGTSLFMWMPQIVETWIQQRVGALSIPMLLMQAPGSFVFVYSITKQPGANWTSWVSFLVAGILQCVLLAECLLLQRAPHAPPAAAATTDGERQPLLAGSSAPANGSA
ncbi:hypothetical protein BJ742DRAFT_780930 [Cladochytrium replicatum]|nr:hypothetical protein BJ742DRAFT_780930 [Cladochytrium replicatum]